MGDLELVKNVLERLYDGGVRELCVCPGKRNALFIQLLKQYSFDVFYFFEERSASFFALGKIRTNHRAVAVLTTSGTAVSELVSATLEAYYTGLPLISVTADRPKRFRGTGAPQSIEQVGIFGKYALCWDLDKATIPSFDFKIDGPCHINVCLEEPQGCSIVSQAPVGSIDRMRFPLVVIGALHLQERERVAAILCKWEAPVYLESLSGLREDPRLQPYRIFVADRMLKRAQKAGYSVDGVIRIGGIPTLRFWRDLESLDLPVISFSHSSFSGLARQSLVQKIEDLNVAKFESAHNFLALERSWKDEFDALFRQEPSSEPGMLAALSQRMGRGSQVYLGNSLPIREWDLGATSDFRDYEVWGSRGVNGIDGQVSTFLGFAKENRENWAVLGDLTSLYDLAGPFIVSPLVKQARALDASLVIVNNGGGKIFSQVFAESEFQNIHQVHFEGWANLWGLSYECWRQIPEKLKWTGTRIVELLPDEQATERFWKSFQFLLNEKEALCGQK